MDTWTSYLGPITVASHTITAPAPGETHKQRYIIGEFSDRYGHEALVNLLEDADPWDDADLIDLLDAYLNDVLRWEWEACWMKIPECDTGPTVCGQAPTRQLAEQTMKAALDEQVKELADSADVALDIQTALTWETSSGTYRSYDDSPDSYDWTFKLITRRYD